MPHILAPRPADAVLPVFWNVNASVGKNGANSSVEDILLVQFFIKLVETNPLGQTPLNLPIVPVTGRMNSETIGAIEALQRAVKITPDGRVSVARGYNFGGNNYTIVHLNNAVAARFQKKWPNLDQLPGCPGPLNVAGRRAIAGIRA